MLNFAQEFVWTSRNLRIRREFPEFLELVWHLFEKLDFLENEKKLSFIHSNAHNEILF